MDAGVLVFFSQGLRIPGHEIVAVCSLRGYLFSPLGGGMERWRVREIRDPEIICGLCDGVPGEWGMETGYCM